jgi:phosphoribosylanthranilate isomerase
MNAQEKKTYEPVPPGEYTVTLNRVGEKQTKNGNGSYIEASFSIQEGDYAKRLLFHSFLINHTGGKNSQVAQQIGREQLDKFLKAVGVNGGFDSLGNDAMALESLVGQELLVNAVIETGTNGYKDRNKIKKFIRR